MDSSVHSASRTTVDTVRFAIKTSPQNTTWADMLAVWRVADDIDVYESGWNEEESGAYGIELGSIKERFDRFEEACQVLTGLLGQETTSFDGKFFQLKDARNEPKGP